MISEWKECTLSELGDIVGGATPSTKNESNYGGNIAWITPKDLSILKGRFIAHGERNITEKGLNSCSAQMMPANTILFSSRAPIGYIAISENPVCTNQGFKSLIPNLDNDPMFLYYLLKYNRDAIEAMGSGTTFKEVSGATMRNIRVRVPSKKTEQQHIASILDSLDSKIEINDKICDNLQQQANMVYSHFFDALPCSSVELSSVIDVRDGTHDSPKPQKEGYSLVTSKHLLPFGVDLSSSNRISKSDYDKINERSRVDTNDILISMIGTVGNISLVIENPVSFAVKNVGLFKTSKAPNLVYYVLCFLKSKEITQHIETNLAGSTQKYISLTELRKLPFIIPADKQLADFNALVKPIFTAISERIMENSNLAQLRDTLLPKLMSGEIDVTDIQF